MFKKLIDKLKSNKQNFQNYNVNNYINKNSPTEEENNIEITISNENNMFKIEINDYISINDYVKKMESSDEYRPLDLLCNCVLWNNNKQKINKGTYFVITLPNHIYNILFTDGKIKIDERIKVKIDEQTQKTDITQERVITININEGQYHYYSAKHEQNGNTFYTKYYDKNSLYSLGDLDLSEEETYKEVKSVIYNLENIEKIETILNIELLNELILKDLEKVLPQKKKFKSLRQSN